MRPFRFGVQISKLPPRRGQRWDEYVRRLESLGYSTIFFPDHFGHQVDPLAAAAACAGVTEKLHLGTLVLGVDYRHPVIVAKGAATIQVLSGGRLELGIGAGWMESDYRQAGIEFDPPARRLSRLEEAVEVLRGIWSSERFSFHGSHYRIDDILGERPALQAAGCERPLLLIGGGGRGVLRLAGRCADIVGINPKLHEGRVTTSTAADLKPREAKRKVDWVLEAASEAGRDLESLELQALVFAVALVDDPSPLRRVLATTTGMTEDEVADCPLFLTGSPSEIKDRLERQREELKISYIVIQDTDRTPPSTLERFAEEVMADLVAM